MQQECLKEYEQIRSEMQDLKKCVTQYMGFVLGGTGIAVFGFAAIAVIDDAYSLAWSAMLLSLIVSLVLVILFYKFTSHNRYAGYCKVLDAEVFVGTTANRGIAPQQPPGQGPELIIAWEICVERLRASDMQEPEYLMDMVDKVDIRFEGEQDKHLLQVLLGTYSGKHPKIDERSRWLGVRRLLAALIGRVRTSSWAFPPYVASVFFVITWGLILLASHAVWSEIKSSKPHDYEYLWLLVPILVLLSVQCVLWAQLSGKLYRLMVGSATVDSYFWRLLLLRAKYLNESAAIKPRYAMISELLQETKKTTSYEPPQERQ
jgi:hypothetical protein